MDDPLLDWRLKGLPPRAEGLTAGALAGLGLSLPGSDLMLPAAILREQALRHNIAAMQSFADRNGALLCPHGKTSMSPELLAMQMEAGAWGLTAATAHHVRIYRRLGTPRILLANQLAGRADTAFVIAEIAADPGFDFYCLVDSEAGADLLAGAARAADCPRPIQVLIEIGAPGGRAGLRNPAAAPALAAHIAAAAPWLRLRGVEAFEGIRTAAADGRAAAGSILAGAVEAAEAIAAARHFGEGPVLLSAGGSAFLDLCTARLPDRIGETELVRVLRPGCYVTHDHGIYDRIARHAGAGPGLPALRPALQVWAAILSVPEPDLAIAGAGKRDLGSDVELPLPILALRQGDAAPRPLEAVRVETLWDQHAALRMPAGALAAGDLIGFGISHPCATFDRWRALLTVDEEWRVTGAVHTLF